VLRRIADWPIGFLLFASLMTGSAVGLALMFLLDWWNKRKYGD